MSPHPPLRCPACREPLTAEGMPAVCAACGRKWGERHGVPDFVFPATDPEEGFPTAAHASVFEREEALHYLSWFRAHLLEQLIRASVDADRPLRILDAGCGTGFMAAWLAKRLPQAAFTLVDLAPEALAFAAERNRVPCYLALGENLPFPDNTFDLVFSLDVYEHLDDDAAAVREAHRVLAPGGAHLVFAPGMMLLWNVGDEVQCHRRRYERDGLRRLLKGAGFTVERVTAMLSTPFPLAVAARVGRRKLLSAERARASALADFWTPPRALNACLKAALLPELWWLRRANLPWGVSLAAVARKKA
ncbi:MAG TPA: methyltransferase domain-containing protein [Candidatus Hydrogenedentes bacterium]|nr:methyltransferase domain-containing protein [Candidatus Hydrogenedentota bacterium]